MTSSRLGTVRICTDAGLRARATNPNRWLSTRADRTGTLRRDPTNFAFPSGRLRLIDGLGSCLAACLAA